MQPVATNLFKVHSLLIPTSVLLLEPGQNNLKPQLWGQVPHLKSQGESITQQSPAFRHQGPPTLTPRLCLPVLLPGPRFTIPHSLPSPWLLLTALSSWNACPSTFRSVFIWPGPSLMRAHPIEPTLIAPVFSECPLDIIFDAWNFL